MPVKSKKSAVLGIDIGGTSIKWAVYSQRGDSLSQKPLEGLEGRIPTREEHAPFSLNKHVQDVAGLIAEAATQAEAQGYSIGSVGIASPGKFIDNGHGGKKIERGSSPNMGAEFDEVNLQEKIIQALKAKGRDIPLEVINDAAAQHKGILDAMLSREGKTALMGKTVGYIGAGTGLGGAFATVDKKGNTTLITDGHLSDVKLSPEDIRILEGVNKIISAVADDRAKAGEDLDPSDRPFFIRDGRVRADDILSSTAIKRLTGLDAKALDHPSARDSYAGRLNVLVHAAGNLIKQVQDGDITKMHDYQNWPEADVQAAQKTGVYIMAGGLFQNDKLGAALCKAATKYMDSIGVKDVTLIQSDVKQAAERAAASSAPQAEKTRSASRG